MKLKKALIFGISGQDGSYLAKLLLSKKYLVHGVSRKKKNINLKKLNINNKVKISILKLNNEKKIFSILNKGFDEIYFCGGQSNIIDSFNDNFLMSMLSISTAPSSGSNRRIIKLAIVVLPLPELPTNAYVFPASINRL